MARFVTISQRDIHDFLARKGFEPITGLNNTKELVYGKIVAPRICLRVYTSVVNGRTRANGRDAIRCVLVTRVNNDTKIIGSDRRVHRVEGWRANLDQRLDNWQEQLGPACPRCGTPTIRKKARKFDFWGCCRFPDCKGSVPVATGPDDADPALAEERRLDLIFQQAEIAQEQRAFEWKLRRDGG